MGYCFFASQCILNLVCIVLRFFAKRTTDVPERLRNAELKDIRVIATIGVGGFGRVELVRFVQI